MLTTLSVLPVALNTLPRLSFVPSVLPLFLQLPQQAPGNSRAPVDGHNEKSASFSLSVSSTAGRGGTRFRGSYLKERQ